nr:topless-related protein 3 [Quercus suber]
MDSRYLQMLLVSDLFEPPSFEALRSPIESAAAKVSGSLAITNDNPVNCKMEGSAPVRPSPIIATTSVVPQHWQPNSSLLMANDVSGVNLEESVLSKNDSYVMSACGGKVSLLNMMTFKEMTTFLPALPASTFLEFHPQDNNIIAIGMEDSTIHTYNVRVDKVKSKLKGHQKRITGLAFSMNLNILVSSGANAQVSGICGSFAI